MAALYNLLLFIPKPLLLFNFYTMTSCFTPKVFTHIFALSGKCYVNQGPFSILYQWFSILPLVGLSCKVLKKYMCQGSTWKFWLRTFEYLLFYQKIKCPSTFVWVAKIKKPYHTPHGCSSGLIPSRQPGQDCSPGFPVRPFSWVPSPYTQLPLLGCPDRAHNLHATSPPSHFLFLLYPQCHWIAT